MRKHWNWWTFFSSVVFFLCAGVVIIGWALIQRAGVRVLEWNRRFEGSANRSAFSLIPELAGGFFSGKRTQLEPQTWLLLGTDEVEGSGRTNVLTDTILIAQLDPSAGVVRLLSLPRDLYFPTWQTKINGLYLEALQAGAARPQDATKQKIEAFTGIHFDGVVVIRPSDIEALIDLIGGVEVDVPQAFTDERFPRSGVDVTKERDPKKLYETVVFARGPQKMDGSTAVKYMRSRHSSQAGEGSDEARVRRQQQVIEAVVGSVVRPDLALRPMLVGSLYRWYSDRFEDDISLFRMGSVMGQVAQTKKVPTLEKISIQATDLPYPVNNETLLIHPPEQKYRQWVYELADPTGQQLREFLREKKLLP